MATFSSVTQQHILKAIEEFDARGGDEFLALYGFEPTGELPIVHEGRTYDSKAILGVAHRYATGRLATSEEFSNGMAGAVAILRKRGFEVVEPEPAPAAVAAPAAKPARKRATTPRAPRTTATSTRTPTREERPPAICPTCNQVLPGTGVCDNCS
ncbi:hypothetical protein [Cellulomonas shaoxiangyii]|uniref:ScoMcrA-like N-terminal head domain-containing protein n=1 Tax=Cellulomonas shaoxiangyii TaxID=2566013 RepID=A0A4P7SIY5_9CELL|nr:hypothetical protein [Cellulomonas shaoxiangyii]QCB92453.1 hypothetical protein E5225_01660 [Cellulomonas shaoxiangyii]TGY85656.1 hypothetical protein E5226_05765 [Cellulomonas shaoxiangyii]